MTISPKLKGKITALIFHGLRNYMLVKLHADGRKFVETSHKKKY